jgi:NADPH:quinone reductase
MRAVVVHHPGGPESLQFEDMPEPQLRPGWVGIRVKAFGLSRSELYARRGDYPETVVGTTRNRAKIKVLQAAGADQVIIDSGEIEPEVQRLVPGGVQALLEMIGAATLRDSLQSMAPKGILCCMGFLGETASLDAFELLNDIPSSVRLTTYASRPTINAANCTQALQDIVDKVATGRYQAHLDRVFPFEEIVAAHRYMDESRATGKIVVVVY